MLYYNGLISFVMPWKPVKLKRNVIRQSNWTVPMATSMCRWLRYISYYGNRLLYMMTYNRLRC